MSTLTRRRLLQSGLVAAATVTLRPRCSGARRSARARRWNAAALRPAGTAPDANGIRLPQGFRSRMIAQSGQVGPQHAATCSRSRPTARRRSRRRTAAGSWSTNSEVRAGLGGVSAIRFDADGHDHRRLPDPRQHQRQLRGWSRRPGGRGCRARSSTAGRIWECDPTGATPASRAPSWASSSTRRAASTRPTSTSTSARTSSTAACTASIPDVYPDLSAGRARGRLRLGRRRARHLEAGARPGVHLAARRCATRSSARSGSRAARACGSTPGSSTS